MVFGHEEEEQSAGEPGFVVKAPGFPRQLLFHSPALTRTPQAHSRRAPQPAPPSVQIKRKPRVQLCKLDQLSAPSGTMSKGMFFFYSSI